MKVNIPVLLLLQLCEYSSYCNVLRSVGTKFPPFLLLLGRAAVALLPLCTLVGTVIQI